jgi:Tfp pilus assembly protein FimT
MFFTYKNKTQGISIIEVLMVVAIISIVTSISVGIFSSLSNKQTLDKEAEVVVSYINKTRSNAINSLSNKEHGVSFASTIYHGTSAVSPATSTVYTLSSKHTIWNVSLTNNLSNFYFYRLSGEPSATGTLQIRHVDGSSKTINIYGTGFVEVQ